jgi:hypothetical protein
LHSLFSCPCISRTSANESRRLGARRCWEKAEHEAQEKRQQRLKEKPFKRLLSQDVLYLMVINMPSDEELAEARVHLERAKELASREKSTVLINCCILGWLVSPRETCVVPNHGLFVFPAFSAHSLKLVGALDAEKPVGSAFHIELVARYQTALVSVYDSNGNNVEVLNSWVCGVDGVCVRTAIGAKRSVNCDPGEKVASCSGHGDADPTSAIAP